MQPRTPSGRISFVLLSAYLSCYFLFSPILTVYALTTPVVLEKTTISNVEISEIENFLTPRLLNLENVVSAQSVQKYSNPFLFSVVAGLLKNSKTDFISSSLFGTFKKSLTKNNATFFVPTATKISLYNPSNIYKNSTKANAQIFFGNTKTKHQSFVSFDKVSLKFYCDLSSFFIKIDDQKCDYAFVATSKNETKKPEETSSSSVVKSEVSTSTVVSSSGVNSTSTESGDSTKGTTTVYVINYVPVPGPAGKDGKDGKDGQAGATNSSTQISSFSSSYSPFFSSVNNFTNPTISSPIINGGTANSLVLLNAVLNGSSVFNGPSFFNDTLILMVLQLVASHS